MKPRHFRLYLLCGTLLLGAVTIGLVLNAAKDGVMYYKTPTELRAAAPTPKLLRLGGLVASNSYRREELRHIFTIADDAQAIPVQYTGIVPALFAEGQGVVVDGHFDGQIFTAVRVLAKHDENYKPPK